MTVQDLPAPGPPAPRLPSIALGPSDLAFLALLIVGSAFIFWLGRSTTFFKDDLVFVGERPPFALDYLMIPHNEHWSALVKLPFQILFSVVGLRSYLPYLALLLIANAAAILAVYVVVSAVAGRVLAFAVGTILLFLGTAHENLFWYSSIGILESLAFGAAATWLFIARPMSARTTAGIGGLLILSVMSSGSGLAFIGGLTAATLLDPARRRGWWGPIGAAAVYVVWYAIWGRSSVSPVTIEAVIGIPGFIFVGASNGIAGATGLGRAIGGIIAVATVGFVWVTLALGRRPPLAAVVGTVGLLTFLGVTALVRVEGPLGSEMASAPRYITTSAALLAIAAAGLLGRPADQSAATLRALALAPIVVLALASNGTALFDAATRYTDNATELREDFLAFERYGGAPAVRDSAILPFPGDRLRALLDENGSLVRDEIRPTVVLPIDAAARDRALFRLVREGLTVVAASGPGDGGATRPPVVVGEYRMSHLTIGGCQQIRPLGPDGLVWFGVPSGGSLDLTTAGSGTVGLYLADEAPFQVPASTRVKVLAGTRYRIGLPDMGPGYTWRFALKIGSGIEGASVCSSSAPSL
jgi:hypothetical protein